MPNLLLSESSTFSLIPLRKLGASAVYALQDGGGGKVIGDGYFRDEECLDVVEGRRNCGKVVVVYVQRM
jgi:hypothetical protein